ncbi:MAG: amidohydrolase family protein [bacterium]
MLDILIENAVVVTMDPERAVHEPGYVAIKDDRIVSVGKQGDCPTDKAAKVIDARGKAVMPGFVNTHTHVDDILLRGGPSDDRMLYDWLFNANYAGMAAYGPEDTDAAANIYCLEAVRAGITTFVDNHDYDWTRLDETTDRLISIYERFGQRAVYARMFFDHMASGMEEYFGAIFAKGPKERLPWDIVETTDQAIASIEACIKRHHGRAEGRIHVWPSPGVSVMTSPEGLLRAKDLAKKYGTMVTGHVSESKFDNKRAGVSDIEFLATVGYLDDKVLAVHCVQVDDNDIRIMARTGTKLAHCIKANMFIGDGIGPLTEMQAAGIVTGMGTDNPSANNTVNMLADMKSVALAQKGKYENAVAMTAERVLEMATIEGAQAIGMEKDIGSLEAGKKADLITIDLSGPHMAPRHRIASTLVYQAMGHEVETVIVDGNILMENGELTMLEPGEERAIIDEAQTASNRVIEKAGIIHRAWSSYIAV